MLLISAASGVHSAVRAGQYDAYSASLTRQTCMQQTTKNRQASLVAAVMLTTSLPAAASEYLPLRFEEN
ncbi:hypothetical protein SAMN05421755_106021 [Nitrosomonas sp. Nm33]|nr:hypothetical protein SAMN05421755_106021 [Nitrosomonas sp. Nm33]